MEDKLIISWDEDRGYMAFPEDWNNMNPYSRKTGYGETVEQAIENYKLKLKLKKVYIKDCFNNSYIY